MSFAFPRWLAESLAFISSVTVHLFVVVTLALLVYDGDAGQPQAIQISAAFDGGEELQPEFELEQIADLAQESLAEVEPQWDANQLEALSIETTADELANSLEVALAPSPEVAAAELKAELEANDPVQFVSDGEGTLASLIRELSGTSNSALDTAYLGARTEVAKCMGHDLRKLQKFKPEYIVVLSGVYDQIERVLTLYNIPHTVVPSIARVDLSAVRVLCINCGATNIPPNQLREFVENGGMVVSTDWGIVNVEQAFPRLIGRARGQSQEDATFPVDLRYAESRLMNGVAGKDGRGIWWLERGSYFVEIRSADVLPLVTSRAIGQRYRTSEVVACLLTHSDGELLQLVSHVYLQDGDQPGLVAMHRLLFNFLMGAEPTVK